MAGGSIDDILARISRLEQTATPGRQLPGPAEGDRAKPDPEPTAKGAGRDDSHDADARVDEPESIDEVDLLTTDTFRDDHRAGGSEAEDDADSAMIDLIADDTDRDDDAMLAIELDDEVADDEIESDDAEIAEAIATSLDDVEPHMAEGNDGAAMSAIEPETPAPEPDVSTESEEPWVIGRDGLKPRSQIRRGSLIPGLDEDDPAASDRRGQSGKRDEAPKPAEKADRTSKHPTPIGDGMISINPGGASSTGMSDLFTPDSQSLATNSSLADTLAEMGAASREQIAAAQKVAEQTPGKDLALVLREQGVNEEAVQKALAKHHAIPFEHIDLAVGLDGAFDGTLLQRLGLPFCAEHKVLPLRKEGSRVVVAVTRPDAAFELDEIRRRLNCGTPKLVLATQADITAALEIAGFGAEERAAQDNVDLTEILEDVDEADVTIEKSEEQTVDLEQKAGESPVIRYVNYIIQTAVREGASDIHIEPAEKKITVRLRVDGVLYESMNPPANMSAAITSRIKIMANLDISERRIPQDGRIRCTVQGRKLDLRVSTLPASYGEKVVMRILDTKSINVQLEDLGFDEHTLDIWKHQIKQAHGIVLVTGPTGSGKTTTLYSSLRQLDKNRQNISTAEDPVEYHLDGITQTQTHEKIGMTFSRVLKALLRQDPDVIMVGEIRDHETAHIAVQAALTGHLVLSTLHTNDAPSSITRLVNIGLEPFLVGAAVNAVLAQRLVRRLCPHCKELRDPPPEQVEFLELSGIVGQQVYMPVGCDRCRQAGYSGRVGIYELLAVDDQLRDIIARNPNVSEFRRMCLERGMHSLRQDGMAKVGDGMTTVAEVLRVTTDH